MNFIPPFPIRKDLQIDKFRIILLEPSLIPKNSDYRGRNVFCLDEQQNIVWQIEKLEHNPLNADGCIYVDILYHDNILKLFYSCDLRVEADYRTGKILRTVEIR
jgi:hypothetical protein